MRTDGWRVVFHACFAASPCYWSHIRLKLGLTKSYNRAFGITASGVQLAFTQIFHFLVPQILPFHIALLLCIYTCLWNLHFFSNLAGFVQSSAKEETVSRRIRHLHPPPSFLFLSSAIHRPLHSTCPWYAKMPPRYVFSSSSSARSSFIIGFLFHCHLLLYYHAFIPSLSVPVCCCKFSSPLVTANVTVCVCVHLCVFPPLPYLSPPLVQPRLIRGHCYGASNK